MARLGIHVKFQGPVCWYLQINNLPIAGDTEIGGLADRFIAKHPQSAAPNDKSQNPRQSGTNPPRDPTKDNLNIAFST